jgi:hypothetical protein
VRLRTKTVFLTWLGFIVYLTAAGSRVQSLSAVIGLFAWCLWLLLDNAAAFPVPARHTRYLYLLLTVVTYAIAIPYAPILAISTAPFRPAPVAGWAAFIATLWLIGLALFEYRNLFTGLRVGATGVCYLICLLAVVWLNWSTPNVAHLPGPIHVMVLAVADMIVAGVALTAVLSINAVLDLFGPSPSLPH